MKKFNILFQGRVIGAIGKMENLKESVEAKNIEDARMKLYEKYEHIHLQAWTTEE